MAMLSCRLHTSSSNFLGHVSSIFFMVIESVGIHITPNSIQFGACLPYNITNSWQQKRLLILGIIGMWHNILWGPCDLLIFYYLWYLSWPHFGHISLSEYSPIYIIQSFRHAWYDMYSTPNIFNFLASSQLLDKTLSLRRTYLWISYSWWGI